MGVIRGRHVSPGIYTKTTSIRNKFVTVSKAKPINTANVNAGGGSGSGSKNFYFGYMPISTIDGIVTEAELNRLKTLDGDDITSIKTIKKMSTLMPDFDLTENKDLLMDVELTIDELQTMLDSGGNFNEIADKHNKCIILLIPKAMYEKSTFKIIDVRFNKEINDLFNNINEFEYNGVQYTFLCMFNEKWSYSTVGKQKVISPLKLKLR